MSTTRLPASVRGWQVVCASVVVGVVALIVAMSATGAALPTLLADPGPAVRWGLPIVEFIVEMASAVTVGAMALCAVVLPRLEEAQRARRVGGLPEGGAWLLARNVGAGASVVWTLGLAI